MSEEVKLKLISASQTFVASFLTVIASTFAGGDLQWTGAFWGAVLLSAVRVALKEVWIKFMPVSLGGKK